MSVLSGGQSGGQFHSLFRSIIAHPPLNFKAFLIDTLHGMQEVRGSSPLSSTRCKSCRMLDLHTRPNQDGAAFRLQEIRYTTGSGSRCISAKTPSYRLHRPTYLAVVTLDGRAFSLGRHGTPESKAEFDRLIAEWLTNGRRLPTVESTRVTISVIMVA